MAYRRETQRISEISEGAILGGLTALIYTMQLIVGVGTAISYLSLIPLVYSGEKSFSEWIKVVIVSTIFAFAFNDIGGALFFILFIVPMSLSLVLRFNGQSISISSGPLFISLVIILSKFSWIVGFTIPASLQNFWVILAFGFSILAVEVFSKFIHSIIEKFEMKPTESFKIPDVFLLMFDALAIISVYGFSLSFVFSVSALFSIFLFEITYSMVKRESIYAFEKIFEYVIDIIRRV